MAKPDTALSGPILFLFLSLELEPNTATVAYTVTTRAYANYISSGKEISNTPSARSGKSWKRGVT